ncbi:helix-turn-helix domain-containing protein [Aquimarina algiphila]|uniref:Helix-turn-helix transcriptional regulator n=1 Tax=Aquimarina algiphila TaxID=2047982 RepID=A0A554VC74_9FLAO|nr:helix-turn-helix transcriptional regulator [Aquimarina algiphila]TSE04267.1 helix-turn-helix transcriptional regulator [Aquimarina algiphila]
MKEKIKQIMDYYGLNQKEFAFKIKVSAQTISDIIKDKRNAGDKITHGILETFDEINPLWLLRDIGEMFLDNEKMKEVKRKRIDKELHFRDLEELALFCANHEDELMKIKVFSNIIEKNATAEVLKLVKNFKGLN